MSLRGTRVGVDWKGRVSIKSDADAMDAVRRFRDVRSDLQDRHGYEVTNDVVLTHLLDVYALHAEREGRETVAEAAERPVATDGGAPR